jgi:hypothetical protein
LYEFNTVADVGSDTGIRETNGHLREVFLGDVNDHAVNLSNVDFFEGRVAGEFT